MATLWSAGNGSNGAQGQGAWESLNTWTQIGDQADWSAIASGHESVLAIRGGTLYAWGFNSYGELGLGDKIKRYLPTPVGSATDWQQAKISCTEHYYNSGFALAIRAPGTLWATGQGNTGQLGLGNTNSVTVWTQVGAGADWHQIAGGGNHALGLRAGGELWAWGNNDYGQLGLGDTTTRNAPVKVGSATWLGIACGTTSSYGIRADGTLWTWGRNQYGQLGLGDTTARHTPTQFGADAWLAVSAYDHRALAVRADGTLWGCGQNQYVLAGDHFGQTETWTQIGSASDWLSVDIGHTHALAIKQDGTIWAVGLDNTGQWGDGPVQGGGTSFQQVSSDINWLIAVAGHETSHALRGDPPAAYEWGLYLAVEPAVLSPEWGLSLAVLPTAQSLFVWPVSLAVIGSAQPEWGIDLAVEPPRIELEWPVSLAVIGSAQPEWGLSLAVYDADLFRDPATWGGHGGAGGELPPPGPRWQCRARVAGADVSARLIGRATVTAEENAAALAVFSLRPAAGAVSPAAYRGARVALHYVLIRDGQEHVYPLFSGDVDTVQVDPDTFALTLTCTDRRQRVLAHNTGLLAGCLWSPAVFDPDAEPLQRAEDMLSTGTVDFHLAPDGDTQVVSWWTSGTDWTIGRGGYLDGSLEIEIADTASLVRAVDVVFDYRFARLRERVARVHYAARLWDLLDAYCQPPAARMVLDALAAVPGWRLTAPPILARPPRASYQVNGAFYLIDQVNTVVDAVALLSRRWAQSVTESTTIQVRAAGHDGTPPAVIGGAWETPFDAGAWEADPGTAPTLSVAAYQVQALLDMTSGSSGRGVADGGIEVSIARARRMILASHRRNRARFQMPLNPLVTRADTGAVETDTVAARGKVYAVEHRMDFDAGAAITAVTLALSLPGTAEAGEEPPALASTPGPGGLDPATRARYFIELSDHIGGRESSPPYDDTMAGNFCNLPAASIVSNLVTRWGRSTLHPGSIHGGMDQSDAHVTSWSTVPPERYSGEIVNPAYRADRAYPWQFRVILPEIEPGARDDLITQKSYPYRVGIPTDALTLSAP